MPGTYTGLNLTGGTVTLQSGTYIFTGDIQLGGQAQILLPAGTGAVTIYALGNVSVKGNSSITNGSLIPSNLMIIGGATATTFDVENGNPIYGAVYGPNSTVTVNGNAQVYGAIVASSLTMKGNGALHYDAALAKASVGGSSLSGFKITSRW